MIKFGPSGLSEDFKDTGLKTVADAAKWIKSKNLDCFEYSFGRGVNLSTATAESIGQAFNQEQVELSVHAPYFINLATVEEDKALNNIKYIMDSLKMLKVFGGNRCVFHPGSQMKATREDAMNVLMNAFENLYKIKQDSEYKDLLICPETMGKLGQLGDLEEIIRMSQFGDDVVPCIDFGHLNARTIGSIKTKDDYRRILDRLFEGIGESKAKKIHVHFSKIEYTQKGESKHLTFDDNEFGPDYKPLMELFKEYKMDAYIVSESAGTQTRDALLMKNYYTMYNI